MDVQEKSVAALYLDEGVSRDVAARLRTLGHQVATTEEIHLRGSSDDEQLLNAARRGSVLIVHNKAHFVLLHDAWRRWSHAWGISPEHHGILILPQTWSSAKIADEVNLFLLRHPILTNQLWHWQPRQGWVDRS